MIKKLYFIASLFFIFTLFTPMADARLVIQSQIDGDFEGFDEDNIYKLMNGQIWIQVEYKYHYHYSFMPQVVIFENHGRFYMTVDGIKESVEVEQLR